jgi:4-methyl-5(b-hydroxyethyl)-thiazole monophosphate biosynthesis
MDACIFLSTGFEEIEAVVVIDTLRRAGVEISTVSITEEQLVSGSHGITIKADKLFEETDYSPVRMLILPGGQPGADHLAAHEGLIRLLATFRKDGWLAAICAAPRVLGFAGLLTGRSITCYPGAEPPVDGVTIEDLPVVHDGNIITGQGPGAVFDFSIKLIEILKGETVANRIAEGLLLKRRSTQETKHK